jgi:hypothetical protein
MTPLNLPGVVSAAKLAMKSEANKNPARNTIKSSRFIIWELKNFPDSSIGMGFDIRISFNYNQ